MLDMDEDLIDQQVLEFYHQKNSYLPHSHLDRLKLAARVKATDRILTSIDVEYARCECIDNA